MTDPSPMPADALRATNCPECGYSLAGLPEEGRCPECGFGYGPDRVVLFGWGSGVHASLANARWRGSGGVILAQSVGTLLVLGLALAMLHPYAGYAAVLLVPLVAMAAYRFHRRHRLHIDSPGPVQVRLFPEGFGQRDGIGPLRLRSWSDRYDLSLGQNFNGRYILRLRWRGRLGVQIHTPVDVEFESDPETIDRLREHIERCRKGKD